MYINVHVYEYVHTEQNYLISIYTSVYAKIHCTYIDTDTDTDADMVMCTYGYG